MLKALPPALLLMLYSSIFFKLSISLNVFEADIFLFGLGRNPIELCSGISII